MRVRVGAGGGGRRVCALHRRVDAVALAEAVDLLRSSSFPRRAPALLLRRHLDLQLLQTVLERGARVRRPLLRRSDLLLQRGARAVELRAAGSTGASAPSPRTPRPTASRSWRGRPAVASTARAPTTGRRCSPAASTPSQERRRRALRPSRRCSRCGGGRGGGESAEVGGGGRRRRRRRAGGRAGAGGGRGPGTRHRGVAPSGSGRRRGRPRAAA